MAGGAIPPCTLPRSASRGSASRPQLRGPGRILDTPIVQNVAAPLQVLPRHKGLSRPCVDAIDKENWVRRERC
jgi:hypothetical protein